MNLRKKVLLTICVAIAILILFNEITFLLIGTQQRSTAPETNPPDPSPPGAPNIFFSLWFMILIAGVVFGFAMMLFLEREVLSRLAKLSASVSAIGSKGDLSTRVKIEGEDELSSLGDNINGMLARLEEAQDELQSINEKLRVVGGLTRHDVRNKLLVITGNAFLVKRQLKGENESLKHLEEIESAVRQVQGIFDFAAIYEKLGVEKLVYIDVKKTVEDAVSLFPNLHGVKVVNDCDGFTVLADSLLRQVFYNLIDNSLKYGEKVKEITVHCKIMGENELKLIFEDDGVGIPADIKEKLFKEGYGKGTGYGLYLIKKICEEYGWIIAETSSKDKGAQFTITIPKTNKNRKENYQLHMRA